MSRTCSRVHDAQSGSMPRVVVDVDHPSGTPSVGASSLTTPHRLHVLTTRGNLVPVTRHPPCQAERVMADAPLLGEDPTSPPVEPPT